MSSSEEAGEASVPSPIYANDNIRVVHTISSSASFDSQSPSNANANSNNSNNATVRVSPNSLQINRTFSDQNITKRVHSAESFASGELVLSDSNDTGTNVETTIQKNTIDQPKSFDTNTSSFDDAIKMAETDSSEEDDEDDSEVLLAKEMALAIAKNPGMTPQQLRELQTEVQNKVQRASMQKARKKEKKKKSKKLLNLSEEMKAAYKETKVQAKKAYKETKAGANHIKKEAKKGLRAAGLMKQSSQSAASTTGEVSTQVSTQETISEAIPSDSNSSPRAAPDIDDDKIRLAGTIWKRRSGLGKYSMTAPWERRKVVLQGSRLIYYKTHGESSDEDEDSTSDHQELQTDSASGWMDTIMDKAGVTMPWESTGVSKGARGYLDLRKEKASASASYGHTGAPTPFALSIKVATMTKYKFCFDTQQELMQWLSAITDVVVAGSVDAYNAEILEANDPSSHGDSLSQLAHTMNWSEPSPRNLTENPNEGRGHQLWATESYQVSSTNTTMKSKSAAFRGSSAEDEQVQIVGASPDDYMVDTSTGDDFLAIPFRYMEPAMYLMNAMILAARSETTVVQEWFWYLLVVFNVLGAFAMQKVQVGGSVKIKPEIEDTFGQKIVKKLDQLQLPTIHSAESTDTGAPALVDENFMPPAGSTSMQIQDPKELPTKDGQVFPGWRAIEASELMVRGVGYKTNKTKVPCPQSLYKCVELDVFESKARVPDMAGRVVLPEVNFDDGDKPKTWSAPDQFVITVALPTDPPKLYGGSTDNGGGYTLTMYCVMRDETRDILKRVTAEGYNPAEDESPSDPNKSMVNAVKLFDEWCRRAPSDDNWMARFKVVPQGNNLAEIGLPAWISNYNGKPFLIKRPGTTGFLYRHPDKSCMEFDVSLHPFPYLAKQGICYMKDGFFKKILATLAFCIEGRSDDELPECLIGLYQLCYPDPVYATQAEDFFAGTSIRSK